MNERQLDEAPVFFNGVRLDVAVMLGEMSRKIRQDIGEMSSDVWDEDLLDIRRDIITLRSLWRIGTEEKVPSAIREAAARIGKWKDGDGRKKHRRKAVESLHALVHTECHATVVSTRTCAANIEKCRTKAREVLTSETLSFEKFHKLRNRRVRPIFHVAKALGLALSDEEGLPASFRHFHGRIYRASRILGGLHEHLLEESGEEHEDAAIDWERERIALYDETKNELLGILDELELNSSNAE